MSGWPRWGLGLAAALTVVFAATGIAWAASGPTLPSTDPFYSYSGSLSAKAPGAVLKTRTVTVAENGSPTPVTATQVLYRTTGELGQPTATVATVISPATGSVVRKIVSYQTAYDALGSQCDPSYTLQGGNSSYSTAQSEEQLILHYVASGDTVVVPDYEGENLDWAAGQESGYGTLDGIRAAESVLNAPVSTPVGMVGYSGGSIATDFAAELAPGYAPKLNIVGTAIGGVPVDFFHNLTYINGSAGWAGVIPAVFDSLSRAFGVSFQQYLSPYGLQVTNQVKDECINDFASNYPGLTYQKLLAPQYQDVFQIAPVVSITDKLIMSRTGTPTGPIFIGVGNADGTGDGIMVTQDDEALAHTYCQRGVSVQFSVYSGDDHTQAAVPFELGASSFLGQRLSGQAVSNGCSSIGAGNSIAPLPVPSGSSPGRAKAKLSLRYRYLGRRPHLHGIALTLATKSGTAKGLVLTLRQRGKLITRVRLARLGTARHRVILRQHGHVPGRGRYTLKVSQGRHTLLTRIIRVR